ncbi:MAG: HEPN domain-containing protein [Burkholderiaceae bacterium]
MSTALTPAKFIEKSERALQPAKLLAGAGEIEGACNRAYYAMYDAAHAALSALKKADYKVTKTHSGLIAAFGLHIVSSGKISRELGRSLNEVEQLRLLADYTGEDVTANQALDAVSKAERFVAAVRAMLSSDGAI